MARDGGLRRAMKITILAEGINRDAQDRAGYTARGCTTGSHITVVVERLASVGSPLLVSRFTEYATGGMVDHLIGQLAFQQHLASDSRESSSLLNQFSRLPTPTRLWREPKYNLDMRHLFLQVS